MDTTKAKPSFVGGSHIAMKVPPHQYEATKKLYGEVLGLLPIEGAADAGYQFGPIQLWIDKVPGISQAEMWLQVCTDDTSKAAEHLKRENVVRCDDIERLSPDFDGFWISSPASIIHLVCNQDHDH